MTGTPFRRALLVVLVSLAVSLAAAACAGVGSQEDATPAPLPTVEGLPSGFQRMAEVWDLLQREHIDRGDLDGAALSDGAIRGMLQALEDPYAAYLTPDQYSIDSQDIQGFFEGIGAEVGMRDGRITIIAPIPDAPAEMAGIRPGDVILEIEGESTQGISLLDAVRRIRGEKGHVHHPAGVAPRREPAEDYYHCPRRHPPGEHPFHNAGGGRGPPAGPQLLRHHQRRAGRGPRPV